MIDEVVILAAGVGSRMATITRDRPKCLAPFKGGTILGRLLGQLARHRPAKIHIVAGHKAEVLRAYVGSAEFRALPIEIVTNDAYATTNSLASAAVAFSKARGQLLMVNSDVVYDQAIIDRMVESDAPFAFAVDRSTFSEESEKVAVGRDGRAVEIAKTLAEADAFGCSVDLYRFHVDAEGGRWRRMLDVFRQRPAAQRRLFEDFLDHTLVTAPFECIDVSRLEWYEIDTVDELKDAEQVFSGMGL